jgi:hypothetical protein
MTDERVATWQGAAALVALSVVAAGLAAFGVISPWPGLVHLVALPPLDLIGDIGILLVHAPDVPTFIAGLAGSILVRSLVMAALLGALGRSGYLAAVRFYVVVAPFALVAAFLLYASKAVLFYALFWAGAVVTLAVFAITAATPWLRPPVVRHGFVASARGGLRLGTLGAYLLGLTVLGALADLGGDAAAIALVPASALLTVATARILVAPRFTLVRRSLAVLPAAGLVALVVVVMRGPASPPVVDTPAAGREGSIMVMSGIDSRSGSGAILEIDPASMGWTCEQTFYFSYAGPGDGQPRADARCPITEGAPYQAEDTLRSREELVPFLAEQAAEMQRPAVVAGHSQGAWLLWDAASADLLPGVSTIVLVGPFPENPVQYPEAGERAPGRVGRLLLGLVEAVPRPGGGTTVFEADSPLGREWLAHPDAVEEVLARPLPDGLAALAIPSAFDTPLMSRRPGIDGATNACPVGVIHPNIPYAAELQDDIVRFLDGEPLPACPRWREAVGPAFRHLSVPPSHAGRGGDGNT